jgi:hypothetical protein
VSPSSCASNANASSARVRRRPRRRPRGTSCACSIGRAGKVPCHGSCEHPQASRSQQDQGRIAEARSLLQPVYDRFSEGFETAELKTAKAQLNLLQ